MQLTQLNQVTMAGTPEGIALDGDVRLKKSYATNVTNYVDSDEHKVAQVRGGNGVGKTKRRNI